MRIGILLALALAACTSLHANPLLVTSVAMESERLKVTFSADAAAFDGVFTFKTDSSPEAARLRLADLWIPIWCPDGARPASEPSIKVDGKTPKFFRPGAWWSPSFTQGYKGITKPEPGFTEWAWNVKLRYPAVQNESPVAIAYTQPLRMLADGGHFYYVPIIFPQHSKPSIIDTNHFSITLTCNSECALTLTLRDKVIEVGPGKRFSFSPIDREEIRGKIKRVSNKGAAANRRPAGQAEGSGNLAAILAAERAFPAAVAELNR